MIAAIVNNIYVKLITKIFRSSDISADILKVCLKRNFVRKEFVLRLLEDRSTELEWGGMHDVVCR